MDSLHHDPHGPVLLVGGYGTVGSALARAAAAHWPLLLAGRSPQRAHDLAAETSAEVRAWDLSDPTPFSATARAVVTLVNDPHDRVLTAALRGGVAYVDITRWTSRLQRALTLTTLAAPTAPVLLSSGWMGGVVPLVAAALAHELGGLDSVEVAIRYDLADRAGADSVEFMDRLGIEFEVLEQGRRHLVAPLSSTRTIDIGGHATKVTRIDTPEQFTLPLTLGASTATTRIGFSSTASTSALVGLGRVGFFRYARGPRWQGLRRRLLHAPGTGGRAQLRVDATGPAGQRRATVTDPAGQAHMTAVGALLGLRRVLGADGAPAPAAGVVFPEHTPQPAQVGAALEAGGVDMALSTPTPRDEAA
ncbi:saccharopine dehydrogenase family protein [Salinactinospora qingdaonensis]